MPVQPRPWAGWAALVLAVIGVHLWLAESVLEDQLGAGAARQSPRRIEVSFVRELQQREASLQAPAAVPRPVAAARSVAPAQAASAPLPVPNVPDVPQVPELPLLRAEPPPAVAVEVAADPEPLRAAEAAASAASAPALAFEWPASTRLSYQLNGYYRGPVDGQARVEWLRSGGRYQVHLDVSIGPSFAPLVTRRMSSDGELSENGLRPRRYDEETKVPLRAPRGNTIYFDDERVRLPAGTEVPLPIGVQDTASQFVQMTWLFTTQPGLLEPGRSVDVPLALPRRVSVWTYDVVERETLETPFGPVATVHVKPRREAGAGGDLTAEMWIAPSLQYLPVRILIRQDKENYADLLIQRLPQQAAPAPLTPKTN
jgi:Protein of unknown function (DUF3108)